MMERPWVKVPLYVGLAVVVFFLILWVSFPTEKIEEMARGRLEAALGHKYTVTFGDFSLLGVSGFEADEVLLQSKPPPPDLSEEERQQFKRVQFTIDHLEVDAALIKSLLGEPEADFAAEIGGGSLEGTWTMVEYQPVQETALPKPPRRRPGSKEPQPEPEAKPDEAPKTEKGHQVKATFEALPLRELTILQAYTGAPLVGDLSGDLTVLVGQDGHLLDLGTDLKIERVAYGPGELPFDTGFGKFNLETPARVGDLTLKTHVEENKLLLDELKTTGPDLTLEANGNLRLSSILTGSRAQINARVKPAAEFLEKNGLKGVLDLDPRVRNAKSGEWYGLLISGTLAKLSYHPSSRTAASLGGPEGGAK
jgi:hypothetical protein